MLDGVRGEQNGDVAQLGERVVRNDEVAGSIPAISTHGTKKLSLGPPDGRFDGEFCRH